MATVREVLYQSTKGFSNREIAQSVVIYGDGKHHIPCDKLSVICNKIYIYSHINKNNESLICHNQKSFFEKIVQTIDIPFYLKWAGYSDLHFELFGSYSDKTEKHIIKSVRSLPIDSTLIISATIDHNAIHAVTEEFFTSSFMSHSNNPYIKYINYLLANPERNTFAVKEDSDIQVFLSDINQLLEFSDLGIANWQTDQIKAFIAFFSSLTINSYNEIEFKDFIEPYISNNYSIYYLNGVENHQSTNLARYKELLLFNYINQNDIEKVSALLENGVSVNSKLSNGATPLYVAAHLGYYLIVKTLINFHAKLDIAKNNKATALMASSHNGHTEIVELLLNVGAEVNSKDENLYTPLMLTSMK
jgi:Ankyrin repeats (3 copies)